MPVDTAGLQRRVREIHTTSLTAAGEEFVSRLRNRVSRRSGQTADSIEVGGVVDGGSSLTLSITVTEESAKYQDEGTGIYGPEGHRIEGHPLLAFDWPAAGGLVIVHSVAGSPGTHFWSRTVAEWGDILAAG